MKNIKAVFIDIDGTIRDSKSLIHQETKDIIEQLTQKNILVILATGRSFAETKKVSQEINASNYIISCNGALAGNYITNKMAVEKPIPASVIKMINNYALTHNVQLTLHSKTQSYKGKKSKSIKEDIYEIVLESTNYERMQIIPKLFQDLIPDIKITNRSRSLINKKKVKDKLYYIDLTMPNISKGNAILEICEQLNLKKGETISIGDSDNDISMTLVTGYSVAMQNATDNLKSASDFITLSNDNDGVSNFLKKLI